MKTLTLITCLLFSQLSMAGDTGALKEKEHENEKGNGGTISEAMLAGKEAELVQVAQKIKRFFLKYPKTMKKVFPMVKTKELVEKINVMSIDVVDQKLVDRYGITRSCLNFRDSDLIQCNYTELEKFKKNPGAIFVLMLHEIFGLMGIEETSPLNATYIEGYKHSKAIYPYATKVEDWDLVMKKGKVGTKSKYTFKEGDVSSRRLVWNPDGSVTLIEPIIWDTGKWRDIAARHRYFYEAGGICVRFSKLFKRNLTKAVDSGTSGDGLFPNYNIYLTNDGRIAGDDRNKYSSAYIISYVTCDKK